jgi:general secretion pathway protein K
MTRHGFALLVVLWLLVVLGALGAVSLATARDGSEVSRNRIWLRRAEWAREACAEILLAKWATRPTGGTVETARNPGVDSVDLGRGSWCSAHLENPDARLNINTADPAQIRALLGSNSLTDALLDWRDPDSIARPQGAEADWYRPRDLPLPRNGTLASVAELTLVKGFDSATVARLSGFLTTDGDGRIDVNAAPPAVLATLPGFDEDVIDRIVGRRAQGQMVASLDGLIGQLPLSLQRQLLASYQTLQWEVATGPTSYTGVVEGRVADTPIHSREVLTLVPVDRRLAVIRRRVE